VRTKSAEVSAARTPPVLASESLREDLAPTEPGRRAMRWVSATVGTLGAGVALGVGEGGFSVSIVAGLLLGCAVLGVVSIRYSARSIGVTVLGLAGLVVAVVATGVEATPPVLAITVTVLAAGLLFRGMYRASGVARALVGIGIALALVWFIGSGAIAGLSVIDTSWQSVGGAIVRLVFALLLLLSLLAFMDSSTTAGCRVWGGALLAWYAVFVALELATRIWPAPGHPADAPDGIVARLLGGTPLGPPDPQVTAMALAGAAFIALVGYAGSHVLVTLSGGTIIHRGGASASQSER
jgi:hypothetical protein